MAVIPFPLARPNGAVLIMKTGERRWLVFAPNAQPPTAFDQEVAALAHARGVAGLHRCAIDIRPDGDAPELVIVPDSGGWSLIVDEAGRITRLVQSRGPALPRALAARIAAAVRWPVIDCADAPAGNGDSGGTAA